MTSIQAEFSKLKRSASIVIVFLLPVVSVVAGTTSTLMAEGGLEEGWHTLWVRAIGFYGMLELPVGVAILASLVWRVEHKNNWNALMNTKISTRQVVLGKIVVVGVLAAVMQVVMLAVVTALGMTLGLPGTVPVQYVWASLIVMLAGFPLAAWQSALSSWSRAFAPPVAIALTLAGLSVGALLVAGRAAIVSPYALLTHATQFGSLLSGGGRTSLPPAFLTLDGIGVVVVTSLTVTVLIWLVHSAVLDRTDTRS